MWQIEDLIRAHNFNLEAIEENIISQFDLDDEQYKAMRDWYDNLIQLMLNENAAEKGHIQAIKNLLDELTELHLAMLKSPYHSDYVKAYEAAAPYLAEFLSKTKDKDKSVIELALEFLYGILMLRLKKQEISEGTQEALDKISYFMALLAKKFKDYETDEDFYI